MLCVALRTKVEVKDRKTFEGEVLNVEKQWLAGICMWLTTVYFY